MDYNEFETKVINTVGDLYLKQIGIGDFNFADDSSEIEDIDDLKVESEKAIKKYGIKKYLCPAILSVSNDISEIAKIVVGVLYPLSISGKLLLPISPLLFSGISLIIFNAGVHSICKNTEDEKTNR